MFYTWIEIVNPYGVDPQHLHERSITQTKGAIAQRVDSGASNKACGSPRLVASRMVSSVVLRCHFAKTRATYATPMISNRSFVTELINSDPLTVIGETAKAMGAKKARNATRVCETESWFLEGRFFLTKKTRLLTV